jgi:hypothetical protein
MRDLVAAIHRPQHTQLIGPRRQLGEQLADLEPRLTMLLEFPRRREQVSRGGKFELRLGDGKGLTIQFGELGLGVEGVDMRHPAVHEEKNDLPGRGWEMRRLGGQRVAEPRGGGWRVGG